MSILDMVADAEELLAERGEVVKRLKSLRARYGGSNNYVADRLFKLTEARVDSIVRAQLKADPTVKVTEPLVDSLVRQHPEYIAALTEDVKQRELWVQTEEELEAIEHRLSVRRSDASLLSAEARLTAQAV